MMHDFHLPLYPIDQVVSPTRPKRHSAAIVKPSEVLKANDRRSVSGGTRKSHLVSPREQSKVKCGRLSEPVSFDPFTGSLSARVLMQPLGAIARKDPDAVNEFRSWFSRCFPSVLTAFQSLKVIPKQRKTQTYFLCSEECSSTLPQPGTHNDRAWQETSHGPSQPGSNELSENEGDDDNESREAEYDAWALLFQQATLVALAPEEEFVTQGRTPSGDVFFVLVGACDISFCPDFLSVLLSQKSSTISITV